MIAALEQVLEVRMDTRKVYRSREDRMIAGVCGGLGKYVGVDPTVIRVIFALLVVFGVGSGLLIYLILMLIIPLEPDVIEAVDHPTDNSQG